MLAGTPSRTAIAWGRWVYPKVWFVARTAVLSYVFVVVAAMVFEEQLVYSPQKFPRGYWSTTLPVDDVYFPSADGTLLHGWYLKHEKSIAPVLYLHGTGGNVTHWGEPLWEFHHTVGASILVFDYRGFGRSQGNPSESAIIADARAARAFLAKREGENECNVVLAGRSLGGAVALQIASGELVRAIVLERTFTSLPAAAAVRYPFFPTHTFMRNRFDSLTAIRNCHGPLLQSHGTNDWTIPYVMGEQLFETSPSIAKEFMSLEGCGHNDPQPAGYYVGVRDFLRKHGKICVTKCSFSPTARGEMSSPPLSEKLEREAVDVLP